MVNLTRAKDAAISLALAGLNLKYAVRHVQPGPLSLDTKFAMLEPNMNTGADI
jgi:hypothetical protein